MKYTLVKIALGIAFATSVHARRQKPLKDATYPGQPRYICDECVPKELTLLPGIGFDLASSYAYVTKDATSLALADWNIELLQSGIRIVLL